MTTFAAIDFETADYGRDSACAIGVVTVRGGRVVERFHRLIRPPRSRFHFTYIHGIRWSDVRHAPTFADLWPELESRLLGADFLAAHNAPFDAGVLNACLLSAGLAWPARDFVCTVRLARAVWGIRPTTLPNVCRELAIPLRHHDPLSDAEASACIVLAARRAGAEV
ncbi:MAG: exonuclease domain-containing protein [Alphaproteobacteria bacterium]